MSAKIIQFPTQITRVVTINIGSNIPKDIQTLFEDLITNFESIMSSHIEVEFLKNECVEVRNIETDSKLFIRLTNESEAKYRPGVHTILNDDLNGYGLAEKIDCAFDDGFLTIWLHVQE